VAGAVEQTWFAAAGVPASADTLVLSGPGNVQGDQNIQFNQTDLLDNGMTVLG
jgi:hypothetical protein